MIRRRPLLPPSLSSPRNPVQRFWGWKAVALMFGIFIILGLLLYAIRIGNSTQASLRYSPQDVVYGEELHASHTMQEGISQLPAIQLSSAKPQVMVDSGLINLGTVAAGQIMTKVVPIANRGDSPLVILNAHTTCGCTTADFTAKEIPPHKVALMTISFDTSYHDLRGQTVRRGIMLETNDPQNQVVYIWFQATVR